MTDIEKMREALDRIPPMTGKVVVHPLPQAEVQSEEQADAMVDTMMASWKKSMDEADRLRAEVRRLRAIEAASKTVHSEMAAALDWHTSPHCFKQWTWALSARTAEMAEAALAAKEKA